jgi:ankyrin repeat protein
MNCNYSRIHCRGALTVVLLSYATLAANAVVKALLAAGADVHKTTDLGCTCQHVAAAHSYPVSVICLLIKAGVDLQAVNYCNMTAAQVAAAAGNALAASLLTRAAQGL